MSDPQLRNHAKKRSCSRTLLPLSAMALLTPGVIFLSRTFVSLLLPCLVIAAVRFILDDRFGILIPKRVVFGATVLAVPIITTIRSTWAQIKKRRRAAALGARLVPKVPGKRLGNFDVLVQVINNVRHGYPADGHSEWIEQLGTTYDLHIFWDDIIFTYEPEHVKTILATDFPNYIKGEKFSSPVHSVLGTGVFNSDGDMWKFHRSMTRPFFSRDRISDFENFERHADVAIGKMKERLRAGYPIDFQDVVSRFTLDSASEFLFGKNVDSLAEYLPYPHHVAGSQATGPTSVDAFGAAFAEAQFIISERGRFGWIWPLLEIFHDKTEAPMKIVNAFLDPIMKDAIEKHQSRSTSSLNDTDKVSDDETLLDHLVKLTTDRTVLRDEILNIMIAGRDTTAATLTFAVYMLASNPAILARLREEIISKVGPSARPTYDDIRDMKYLRAVINETLRLYPAVPFDVRQSVNEAVWPSQNSATKPIYIPANTSIVYSVFLIQRRTDLWGPDALEFDPDRFLDDRTKKYLTHNPFIFVPFNAGPRICLGQQFAYNEMSFMLIRLLQNFSSIELDIDAQPPNARIPRSWATAKGRKAIEKVWPKAHLTMYAHGGLWVKMEEASYV
ncbi:hypothetical protein PILCRDRAFT_816295 [Piloderma croceum F 1598]|uniref:Cytochrome P450 monooxygenase pc-3 n=1 Tax=Piloderma croceum (strain F 1598) TaxID=765440 RepID=A0A0C3G3B2_PILCF|nr:hypothetical protein PILCRDRAFT_816295 [Piloderma croceum F 1598]